MANYNPEINSNNYASELSRKLIDELQQKATISVSSENIYNEVKSLSKTAATTTLRQIDNFKKLNENLVKLKYSDDVANKVLKLIVENFLDEYNKEMEGIYRQTQEAQFVNLGLVATGNPNYYISKEGKYYFQKDYSFIEEKSIVYIDKSGNYTMRKRMGLDYIIEIYNKDNLLMYISMENSKNKVYINADLVAYKLGMKKEYVNKYKLKGMPGDTLDFISILGNTIFSPTASGYYMDRACNFYKWNRNSHRFEYEERTNFKYGINLMSDYEVKSDSVVVRTDYNGNYNNVRSFSFL